MQVLAYLLRHYRKLMMVIFLFPSISNAQMLEIAGGTNINTLYIPHTDMDIYPGLDYKDVPGWSAAVKISGFSPWGNPVVALLVDKCNSHMMFSRFSKTTVGIGFYPVNLKIFKNLHLQAGPELSFLYTAKGEREFYIDRPSSGSGYGSITIRPAYSDSWIQRTQLGASASLTYAIELKQGLYVTPQYKFYNNVLTPDVKDTHSEYYSRRHSFMVSIGKKFN